MLQLKSWIVMTETGPQGLNYLLSGPLKKCLLTPGINHSIIYNTEYLPFNPTSGKKKKKDHLLGFWNSSREKLWRLFLRVSNPFIPPDIPASSHRFIWVYIWHKSTYFWPPTYGINSPFYILTFIVESSRHCVIKSNFAVSMAILLVTIWNSTWDISSRAKC